MKLDGNDNAEQTLAHFRHRKHAWFCLCTRFVLRLLWSRWVGDLYFNCLPHMLSLRKELAYCQQHTESNYFTIDDTIGITIVVRHLCAHTNMHFSLLYAALIFNSYSFIILSITWFQTLRNFKADQLLFFFFERQENRASRGGNPLTLS